nr:hypothetical protein [Petrotoga sibirica]
MKGLQDVKCGVGIGLKSWLEAKDVINTYEVDQVFEIFKQKCNIF